MRDSVARLRSHLLQSPCLESHLKIGNVYVPGTLHSEPVSNRLLLYNPQTNSVLT